MLAYRLRIRNILVAAVEFYDDEGQPGPHPTFLQFPADPLLRGQRILVVDEVWDSGTTIHAVTERIRQAGGLPTTAVLHYKPTHSVVPGAPDVHAVDDRRLGRLSVQGRGLKGDPTDDEDDVRLLVGHQEGRVHPRERRGARATGPSAGRCARAGRSTTSSSSPGPARSWSPPATPGTGPAIWRSEDGGATWTHSSAGMTYGDDAEPIKTIWSLAATPDGGILAGVEPAGLFRSDDGGDDLAPRRGPDQPPDPADLGPGRRRPDPAHDHPPPDRPRPDVGRDLGRRRVRDARRRDVVGAAQRRRPRRVQPEDRYPETGPVRPQVRDGGRRAGHASTSGTTTASIARTTARRRGRRSPATCRPTSGSRWSPIRATPTRAG